MTPSPRQKEIEMFMSEKVRKNMETGSWIRKMFDEGNTMKKRYGADKSSI